MPPPIRILRVDDNPLVAEAIALQLRGDPDLTLVGVLRSAETLVEEARRVCPDVVVLDIDMPGMDPFEAVRRLASERPAARVLMFSGLVRPDLIDRAFDAGAWGYIAKSEPGDAILRAIRAVAAGQVAMGRDVRAVYGGM